jgi:L,D-transpeptidase YcbB
MLAAAPLPLYAAAPSVGAAAAPVAAANNTSSGVADFYRARAGRPLWLAPQSGAAAQLMLGLLNSASVDGLDPRRYDVRRIANALRDARRGDARAVHRAETLLSHAFVSYARDLRRAPNIGVIYVDRELVPAPPTARYLRAASPGADEPAVHEPEGARAAHGQSRARAGAA